VQKAHGAGCAASGAVGLIGRAKPDAPFLARGLGGGGDGLPAAGDADELGVEAYRREVDAPVDRDKRQVRGRSQFMRREMASKPRFPSFGRASFLGIYFAVRGHGLRQEESRHHNPSLQLTNCGAADPVG